MRDINYKLKSKNHHIFTRTPFLSTILLILYPKEQVIDDNSDLTELVIERYGITQEVESEEEGGDGVDKITLAEAKKALETLRLYELQCPNGRKDVFSKLDNIKSVLNQRQQIGAKQAEILYFFQRVVISEPPDLLSKALNLIRNCLRRRSGRVRRNFGTLSKAR
jgi:hypothetical protein